MHNLDWSNCKPKQLRLRRGQRKVKLPFLIPPHLYSWRHWHGNRFTEEWRDWMQIKFLQPQSELLKREEFLVGRFNCKIGQLDLEFNYYSEADYTLMEILSKFTFVFTDFAKKKCSPDLRPSSSSKFPQPTFSSSSLQQALLLCTICQRCQIILKIYDLVSQRFAYMWMFAQDRGWYCSYWEISCGDILNWYPLPWVLDSPKDYKHGLNAWSEGLVDA